MRHRTVLLTDSNNIRRAIVQAIVARAGWMVRESAGLDEATALCRTLAPAAVLFGCDDRLRDAALRAVAAIRGEHPTLPVLLIVEKGSEEFAVAALRAGVTDYLRFPVKTHELITRLARCTSEAPSPVAQTQAAGEPVALSHRARSDATSPMIGSSDAMQRVQSYLAQAAQGDSNVLITGETGTGKELAAAYLHDRSRRAKKRFVTVNCAAIPDALLESELFGHEKGAFTGASVSRPGLLESADGGTMFLDEIGEMGMQAQAKILRAVESREVYRIGSRTRVPLDVRIVAATNQNLEDAIEAGRFRKDLYYRVHVASVHLPPLRERPGDIGELLDHYLREFSTRARQSVELCADARRALESYEWPGNVRELKNLVECLFVCPPSTPVRVENLPESFRSSLQRLAATSDTERRALLNALFEARWNKSRAAELLECSRMTLYRRMAKYSVVRSKV